MSYRRMIMTVALALGVARGTHATEVFTPPLQAQGANDLNCRVLNASSSATGPVTIQIFDGDGGVLATCPILAVSPFFTESCSTADGPGEGWCKVSGSFSRSRTRVTLSVRDSGGSSIAATFFAP